MDPEKKERKVTLIPEAISSTQVGLSSDLPRTSGI